MKKYQRVQLSPKLKDYYKNKKAEQPVQQERMPQPPPLKPVAGIGETLLPEPVPKLKAEMIFFTFFEEHFGHSALFSAGYKLCRSANLLLHLRHIYS